MANLTSKAQAMVAGLTGSMPGGQTAVTVDGKSMTVANLIASLNVFLTAAAAVPGAKVAFHQAVAAMVAQEPQTQQLIAGLNAALRSLFGKGSPVLAQFGISTKAATAPSTAVKAEAVVKRKATRVARNTLGPKAKLKVTATSVAQVPAENTTPPK